MAGHQHVGAEAPGPLTPIRDEARTTSAEVPGSNDQNKTDKLDFARKPINTAIAQAARMGIEAHEIHPGAWLLRHANGAPIGSVSGPGALIAAVDGFQAARDDVQALVSQLGNCQ